MNSLKGDITKSEVNGKLSLVSLKVGSVDFKSIVIETPETVDYLREGGKVQVMFKETEVIIGKGENLQISLRNKMFGNIKTLEVGKLLAQLTIDTDAGEIISIITANAVKTISSSGR